MQCIVEYKSGLFSVWIRNESIQNEYSKSNIGLFCHTALGCLWFTDIITRPWRSWSVELFDSSSTDVSLAIHIVDVDDDTMLLLLIYVCNGISLSLSILALLTSFAAFLHYYAWLLLIYWHNNKIMDIVISRVVRLKFDRCFTVDIVDDDIGLMPRICVCIGISLGSPMLSTLSISSSACLSIFLVLNLKYSMRT